MPPKPITMLSGLTTVELTLTKRGANNRRFAMTKGGYPMDPEILQALIGTPAEGEDQFMATLKTQGVTDQSKLDAAVASYRIQKGMKDLVDDKTMSEVTKAAGYTAKAFDKDKDKKPGAMDDKVDPKAKKAAKKSFDLSGLDDATRASVEAVFKSHQDMATKSVEMEAVVKSLSETVGTLKDEKEETHYVAKAAKDYAHLPLGEREIGLMLKSAHTMNPDFAKGFETLLGRMDEMVEKSSMLTTMGAINKSNEGGAWSKLEALADGIVQKSVSSANPISKAAAMDVVLKSESGKALYREYLGDNPVQRAPHVY